ncbi:MAG TPA: sucrase ferredoxin [Acidimicrobiales bacterium]|nr:sucrase ferredoxin [Acidimicrobiales bacterium]
MAPDRETCATGSAARGEPLMATASRVRSWILLEQPGAWGPDALSQSGLDATVAAALAARCRRHQVRPLLIRRPGFARPGPRRQCYLAHSGVRRSWVEALTVVDPAELLDLDWSVLDGDRAPALGEQPSAPVSLVCTNGRHDRCCAVYGRPLARALVAAGVPEVWECSHIGGDRFAANLVCLPEGVYFGRVGPDEGPAVAADYRRGLLTLDRYRGRSSYPPLVQAAEMFVRQGSGTRHLDGLALQRAEQTGDHTLDATFVVGAETVWRVRVERQRSTESLNLTCRSAARSRPWEYYLADLAMEGPVAPGGT